MYRVCIGYLYSVYKNTDSSLKFNVFFRKFLILFNFNPFIHKFDFVFDNHSLQLT